MIHHDALMMYWSWWPSCTCDHATTWQTPPWEPGYDMFIPGNRPGTVSFLLSYQQHSSFANCTRELFKPSKDL